MKKKNTLFSQAIKDATEQAMNINKNVFIMGQLIDYSPGAFGTTKDLINKFGPDRVRDFPASESAMTSAAIGASISGKRPILVHMRTDFMLYSLDAIVNWLSMWRFKTYKKSSSPLVIRVIVGKGWGQGPQHSKSIHSWFANLPGINVVMPSTPFDVKGLLIDAIFSNTPTIIVEHRSLFNLSEKIPIEPYSVPIGKGVIRRHGKDLSIITFGSAVVDCMKAASLLKEKYNLDAEVVDLRSLKPLDKKIIFKSLKKTKRLIVVDAGWLSYGAASEIVSLASENKNLKLISKPKRICLPDSHTPMSEFLEKKYYFNADIIVSKIQKTFKRN